MPWMQYRRVDQIAKEDVDALVADRVPERRWLEFKGAFPSKIELERQKFLEDISSFANDAGGYLLYGIEPEKDTGGNATGLAKAATGIPGNMEPEINKLGALLRRWVQPRMQFDHQVIEGFPSGSVVIFYIPPSSVWPHAVTMGEKHPQFFVRYSLGKCPMTLDQIRDAFLASESLSERIRAFRQARIARIAVGKTPVLLPGKSRTVLHVIPFSAERGLDRAAAPVARMAAENDKLPTLTGGSWNVTYNIDGMLNIGYRRAAGKPSWEIASYVQVFRSGALEAVDGDVLIQGDQAQPRVSVSGIEKRLRERVGIYLETLGRFGILPPYVLALSLTGVLNAVTSWSPFDIEERPLMEDVLVIPERTVANREELESAITDTCEILWQAFGFPGRPSQGLA
jgi:hypothetical protein